MEDFYSFYGVVAEGAGFFVGLIPCSLCSASYCSPSPPLSSSIENTLPYLSCSLALFIEFYDLGS